MSEKIAILIPTRNQPLAIEALLETIEESTIKPEQVIIVSSGEEISSVVDKFKDRFPIDYEHTSIKGQIAQKRIGIGLIERNIDWCLFLDDDLLLESQTLEITLHALNSNVFTNVVGAGLAIPSTSRSAVLSKAKRRLAKSLQLWSEDPGRVLKSGHATSYLDSKSVVSTQWLNGASIWKSELVGQYGKGLPSTPYAACEDLIFSYPNSKIGTLIFIPNAKVNFQSLELSPYDNFEVIKAASYWRYFFVLQHQELSIRWFFFSQVVRSIFALLRTKESKIRLMKDLFS